MDDGFMPALAEAAGTEEEAGPAKNPAEKPAASKPGRDGKEAAEGVFAMLAVPMESAGPVGWTIALHDDGGGGEGGPSEETLTSDLEMEGRSASGKAVAADGIHPSADAKIPSSTGPGTGSNGQQPPADITDKTSLSGQEAVENETFDATAAEALTNSGNPSIRSSSPQPGKEVPTVEGEGGADGEGPGTASARSSKAKAARDDAVGETADRDEGGDGDGDPFPGLDSFDQNGNTVGSETRHRHQDVGFREQNTGSEASGARDGTQAVSDGMKAHAEAHHSGAVDSSAPTGTHGREGSSGEKADPVAQRAVEDQLFSRIVDRATLVAKNGRTEFNIALKPDFLGHCRMRIATDHQMVTLRILTENPMVKEAIEQHLHQLKADLQSAGLEVDSVDVQVSDDTDRHDRQRQAFAFENPADRGSAGGTRGGRSESPTPPVARKHPWLSERGIDCFA